MKSRNTKAEKKGRRDSTAFPIIMFIIIMQTPKLFGLMHTSTDGLQPLQYKKTRQNSEAACESDIEIDMHCCQSHA